MKRSALLSTTLALSVFSAVSLSGCSTTQMTLAQELAWERWEKCRDVGPTVKLEEIRPDGHVRVSHRGGSNDGPTWQECMRKAAEEQSKRRGVAVAAPSAATTPPLGDPTGSSSTEPSAQFPVWRVGDEWAFRWETPRASGTFVWSVDREEFVEGSQFYVLKAGNTESYFRKDDLAFYMHIEDKEIERRLLPPVPHFLWPITTGKAWEQSFTLERPKLRRTDYFTYACQIAEREESVTVPAGTFTTFKVTCRNKRTNALAVERWYAPQVRFIVRERTPLSSGISERELLKYRLR